MKKSSTVTCIVILVCQIAAGLVTAADAPAKMPERYLPPLVDVEAATWGTWGKQITEHIPSRITASYARIREQGDADMDEIQDARREANNYRYRLGSQRRTASAQAQIQKELNEAEARLAKLESRLKTRSPLDQFMARYCGRNNIHTCAVWIQRDTPATPVDPKTMENRENAVVEKILHRSGRGTIRTLNIGDSAALYTHRHIVGSTLQSYVHAVARTGPVFVDVRSDMNTKPDDIPVNVDDVVLLTRSVVERITGRPRYALEAPADGIPAHPKNLRTLTLVLKTAGGQPLAGAETVLKLGTPGKLLMGGWIFDAKEADATLKEKTQAAIKTMTRSVSEADDLKSMVEEREGSSLRVAADNDGRVTFKYVPPMVDKVALPYLLEGVRAPRRELAQGLWINTESEGVGGVSIPLDLPHPRVDAFGTGSGVDAGYWGKKPAQLTVADRDSTEFHYRISGIGDFRLFVKGSAICHSRLESSGGPHLEYLYCPPKMGLDLTDLPDLQAELVRANIEFAVSYIEHIAKIPGIKGKRAAEYFEGWGLLNKIRGTAQTVEDALLYIDKQSSPAGKAQFSKKLADDVSELRDLTNEMMETIDSLTSDAPLIPAVEAGKLVVANLEALEKVHDANWKIATSYDDTVFLPIRAEITDSEGHRTMILRKVGVMVPKEMNE